MPTIEELESLFDESKVTNEWITEGGIPGRKFTDIDTGASLFLPAAGYRSDNGSTLNDAGGLGYYWSSTQDNSDGVYGLYFYSSGAGWSNYNRSNGKSLRAVAE